MLLVSESFVNVTEGWRFGDTEPYEPYTEDIGDLFRDYQREFGRCASSMYVDTPEGARRIGWVFEKRMQYTDTGKPYLQETWVSLHDDVDTVERTTHYHHL